MSSQPAGRPTILPDDTRLTPEQRRREVASVLARGILRLARVARTTPVGAASRAEEHAPESPQKTLEASTVLIPHVTGG